MAPSFSHKETVCVVGLGYVGLTLAATFAKHGKHVFGLDTNRDLVSLLQSGGVHIHEPGLAQILKEFSTNMLFGFELPDTGFGTYVVAVNSNVDDKGRPDLSHVRSSAKTIGGRLKKGDAVIYRSTLPIGTMRKVVISLLERYSGLRAGADFFVAFAPERTVEGNALEEIRVLPQIIGGYTEKCARKAKDLFSLVCRDVVMVRTLEEAEMTKLVSNAYRDFSFAFANSLSQIAYPWNIDIHSVIMAANYRYGRNNIPRPSAGVGGYCLTKDPLLLASATKGPAAALIESGRELNRGMAEHAARVVDEFVSKRGIKKTATIVIVGLAFKADPATSDIRFSPAIDLAQVLEKKYPGRIFGADPLVVIDDEKLVVKPIVKIPTHNAVYVFMHGKDYLDILKKRTGKKSNLLAFDTTGAFDASDLVKKGWHYANLSYATYK